MRHIIKYDRSRSKYEMEFCVILRMRKKSNVNVPKWTETISTRGNKWRFDAFYLLRWRLQLIEILVLSSFLFILLIIITLSYFTTTSRLQYSFDNTYHLNLHHHYSYFPPSLTRHLLSAILVFIFPAGLLVFCWLSKEEMLFLCLLFYVLLQFSPNLYLCSCL